ncbi:Ig-like domain (group 3) [Granulicella rosea]|uniref:Ig-like domain (Group 3) n=1 Tax=Granulicella rosea TaxID=474952 RepID=A0A239M6X3_9BACT|nr:Ig-like domain repeat protein [Granulicella rosea]SNT37888.1 Ig-like domain (group 3) [Granulicella rosea]
MTSRHILHRLSSIVTMIVGLFLFVPTSVTMLHAQSTPRLVPYFVTAIAGNGAGTIFTTGQACPHGDGLKALDTYGTGCLAVDATLNSPTSVVVDKDGNIYFGEANQTEDWNYSALVKKIDAKTGVLSIFAGGSATNPLGPCDSPDKNVPGGGNIYGDGCAATYANFQSIYSLAIDANYLYIADFNGSFIHKVSLAATPLPGQTYAHEIQVVIGDGTQRLTWVADGVGTMMYFTSSIAVNASNTQSATKIAFTDDLGTAIRVADLGTRQTTTVVGPGCSTLAAGCKPVAGCAGAGTVSPAGPNSAKTNAVRDLTFDKDGNLFFTESSCLSIREITAPVDGTTQNKLVFGLGVSGGSGLPLYAQAVTAGGAAAHLSAGRSISADLNSPNSGVIYYMDSGKMIWMYDQATGWMHQIFGVTGTANTGCGGSSVTPWNNCPAPYATLSAPAYGKISTDQAGNLYIATPDNFVRKIAVGTDFIGTAPASAVAYPGTGTQYAMLHGAPVTAVSAAAPFTASAGLTIGAVTQSACSSVLADGLYDCPSTLTFTPVVNGLANGTLSVNAGASNYPIQAVGTGVPAVVTTTALTITPSTVTTGQAVSFSALITPASTATGTPSGTVTFYNGSTPIGTGTLAASGVASFSTSALAAGNYTVTATYPGDNIFAASTSSAVALVVNNPVATSTTLTASATTAFTGVSLTFNASVVPATGAAVPSGSIVFYDGAIKLATVALQSGKAAYTTSSLTAATHPITAAYLGDTTFLTSVSPIVNVTVSNPVSTSTVLSASATTAVSGTSIVLTATVAPTSGTAALTGSVTFYDGAVSIGSSALTSGKATLTTSTLSIATHSITAAYTGDTGNAASTSAALSIVITPIPPDFNVAFAPASGTVSRGGTITSVLTVTPQGGFAQPVTFTCAGLPLETTCTFSPATVTSDGAHAASTTLTLQTNVKTAALHAPLHPNTRPGAGTYAAFTFLGIGSSFGAAFSRRRNANGSKRWIRLCSLLLLTLASFGAAIGCGSNPPPQTPTGVSTITVTATAGTLVHTTSFTLTVQ